MGTAQNRKVYTRHGVRDELFGVSFANLKKLHKSIQTDQNLAFELWETGNHDARVLATMIADPVQMNSGYLKAWVKRLNNYIITDAFSKMASKSPRGQRCMEKWIQDKGEWVCSAGWNVLAELAMENNSLSDEYFHEFLNIIQKRIHQSKNRVKHSMNNALIAIGVRNPALEQKAVEIADRIGLVEVDHGETECTTPDAVEYIEKTLKHRENKSKMETS